MSTLIPSQLLALLIEAIKAQLPVLVVGGPGIGKTSICKQACDAVGADLITSHPATEDPTVPAGLPWAEKGAKTATFLPFGNTARALAATKLTFWFWDDLGQAPAATQASYMPWLLARRLNGHALPDCVSIGAATNRRTDRAGVTGILEPVKSRFAAIVELVPDVNEWSQWAIQQAYMPPELVAYIRFQPDALYQFTPSADLINCPLPRTWENAGRVLSLNLPKAVEAASLAGAVGEGEATKFLAFRDMYRQLPSIDGILLNPDTAAIPQNLGALFAVVTGLAAKTNEQNFGRVAVYVQRLADAARGDFAALCIRDAARRTPALQQTPDFVKLMLGDLGALINGTASR